MESCPDKPQSSRHNFLRSKEFSQVTLWQNGPAWLSQDINEWPKSRVFESQDPKEPVIGPSQSFALRTLNPKEDKRYFIENLLEKYDNIKKLKTVLAYC